MLSSQIIINTQQYTMYPNMIRLILFLIFIFFINILIHTDPQHLNTLIHTLWSEKKKLHNKKHTKKIGGKKNEEKKFGSKGINNH